ncbi:TPA: transcription termination/antitermination protein NusA [Patescibacteria group bacterium]|nr:transcription termination/antitermination protein NusA [Patescibacteria group bacterium]HCU48195.1 transcription termination/antitermination protein NusA [Patescibacteria group bacterium]
MKQSSPLMAAIEQICEEKNISVEAVLETIEQALAAAYRKDFGEKNENVKVKFDPATGASQVFDVKTVVEGPAEGEETINEKKEILLADAIKIKPDAKVADEIKTELKVPADYGRMAAQTAKQVIIQRLREAEREVVFSEYKEKEGQVIPATVQRVEGRTVFVNIGHTVAVMPYSEQVAREHYTPGQRLRVFLVAVNAAAKGPEVLVSRAHPEIVRQLFTLEVPEIASGAVAIKAISREAGSRTKIAVAAKDANIDPIGSCVGQRGTRVQTVINELGGEKIDIIAWSEDISKFITAALAPAKVQNVTLNEEEKSAKVEVSDDQLSLAIGRGGQNVRLAVKLTGWKIDIVGAGGQPIPADSEAPAAEGEIAPVSAEAKPPAEAAADSVSVDEKTTGASASNTAAEEPTEIPAPAAASNSDEVK